MKIEQGGRDQECQRTKRGPWVPGGKKREFHVVTKTRAALLSFVTGKEGVRIGRRLQQGGCGLVRPHGSH